MTNLLSSEISTFAIRHSVPLSVAYALPTIFESIANMTNQPIRAIVSQATYTNQGLADYIKEVAAKVA